MSRRVIHRGGRPAVALAQWWSCGGGGRTSPTWCCRPTARAAVHLVRRSARGAGPRCTGARRGGCGRCRSRPGCRWCTRWLPTRPRCARCCSRTRNGVR
ncbi:hypothetical protein SHJG_4475 [Streptomyces hygroscopicus subsp. jinggangensis 5008]|nr:hypothetical protein SHJG_4475 [Streptomyces hygroscopicus subsp. jinggangensis 5008]